MFLLKKKKKWIAGCKLSCRTWLACPEWVATSAIDICGGKSLECCSSIVFVSKIKLLNYFLK